MRISRVMEVMEGLEGQEDQEENMEAEREGNMEVANIIHFKVERVMKN